MADRLRSAQRAEAGVARITPETVVRFGAAVAGALTLHSAWTAWSLGKTHIYHEIAAMDLALYALGVGLLWLAPVSAPRWRRWSGPLILVSVRIGGLSEDQSSDAPPWERHEVVVFKIGHRTRGLPVSGDGTGPSGWSPSSPVLSECLPVVSALPAR